MTHDPLPHGRTARRLRWAHLPPELRTRIEHRLGGPVVEAASQDAGFTPAFASVLTLADGSRHFVKAASTKAQRLFANSYRAEGERLGTLPDGLPAPRLRWMLDADDWVVLGLEYVDHTRPARPWQPAELDRALDLLEETAHTLTPNPVPGVGPLVDDLTPMARLWHGRLLAQDPELAHGLDAADLAARVDELVGDTLVHSDVRDDNVLLRADGRALLCDWSWAATGPAWFDSLCLLIGARGDGVDVERIVAERPLLRAADPELIDVALAVLTGYFLAMASDAVPSNSPWLRAAQAWQGEAAWSWLRERRGWS